MTGWSKLTDLHTYKPRWRLQDILPVTECKSYFSGERLENFNYKYKFLNKWFSSALKKATICTEFPEKERRQLKPKKV